MDNVHLLTRIEFAQRCERVWAEFDQGCNRLFAVIGTGMALLLVAEFVLPRSNFSNWAGAFGITLAAGGPLAVGMLEGRRFDLALRSVGLTCPFCGDRLAGSARVRGVGRYVPGALDRAVENTGECQRCRARVLARIA